MGFGTSIMKTLMFVFNGIVWVLGLVLFIVGIVVLVEGQNWNDIIDNKTVPVSALLIVVGLVIAVVGFLGCFGALKQNSSMLLIYAIILGVIIIIQLVAGILAFIFSDEAKKVVTMNLATSMDMYGASAPGFASDFGLQNSTYTRTFDWIQSTFKCCGIASSSDWSSNSTVFQHGIHWTNQLGHENDVPDSCCKTIEKNCGYDQATGVSELVYNEGCLDTATNFMESRMALSWVLLIFFILIEAGTIVLAFFIVYPERCEKLNCFNKDSA